MGKTVAGGNGWGSNLNQLYYPYGIFLDDDSNLYIADEYNHRVVKWDYGSTVGQVVAGGNGEGEGDNQLSYPNKITVAKNGTMFICTSGDRKIKKWEKNAREGQTIVTDIRCSGIHTDNQGSIYFSEPLQNFIMRWPGNEIIAGGNGAGSELNQLYGPYNFFIKNNTSLFIADGANYRILEWIIGDKQGIIRAQESDGNELRIPMSVILDDSDNLYIADFGQNKILRWLKNSTSEVVIAGDDKEGKENNQFSGPSQILFDKIGNLWVCDEKNHRVQMFEIDKSSCKN